ESPLPPSSPFAQVAKPASSARPISVPSPTPPRPSESSKPPSAPRPSAGTTDRAAVTAVERPSVRRIAPPEATAAPEPVSAPAPAEAPKTEPVKVERAPAASTAVAAEASPKTRGRSSTALLVMAAIIFLVGVGILVYTRDRRAKRAEARAIDAEVTKLLEAGKIADLPS